MHIVGARIVFFRSNFVSNTSHVLIRVSSCHSVHAFMCIHFASDFKHADRIFAKTTDCLVILFGELIMLLSPTIFLLVQLREQPEEVLLPTLIIFQRARVPDSIAHRLHVSQGKHLRKGDAAD